MPITDFITYNTGAKGKPAVWTCGNASIKAPILKKVAVAVQAASFGLPPEVAERVFASLMEIEGQAGKEFLGALTTKKLSCVELVEYISKHEPHRGRVAIAGPKNRIKIIKIFAKALAAAFPSTIEKQAVFIKLNDFLEKTENQEAIYSQFQKMATENGCNDATGMINPRNMSEEKREALRDRGRNLGTKRGNKPNT